MSALFLPPPERTHLPVGFIWKPHTVYLVRVAYGKSNPIHTALLHVGFLSDAGQPAGYSEIWINNYEKSYPLHKAHYLEVLQELVTIPVGA